LRQGSETKEFVFAKRTLVQLEQNVIKHVLRAAKHVVGGRRRRANALRVVLDLDSQVRGAALLVLAESLALAPAHLGHQAEALVGLFFLPKGVAETRARCGHGARETDLNCGVAALRTGGSAAWALPAAASHESVTAPKAQNTDLISSSRRRAHFN
jgi:hypothetical protein